MLLVLGIIINKFVCWVLGFFYLSFVWSVFKLGNDSLINFGMIHGVGGFH